MTKRSDIEMVAKARAWAIKAHAGQKDKAGKDYFRAHVAAVAERVKGDPVAETVAFLHDTVEDTSITIEDIRTGFPKEVADAVDALTQSKNRMPSIFGTSSKTLLLSKLNSRTCAAIWT